MRCDGDGARVALGRGVATVCRAARPRWRGREEKGAAGEGGAAGHGVATVQSSEASLAWARGENDNYDDGGDGNDDWSSDAARQSAQSEGGAKIDDNYGGDDNYPRVVAETGAAGREEGRGWDRQK
jgi:hypothetical protein